MQGLDEQLKEKVWSKLGFSRSYVHTWELDHKEIWTLKNWCFQTVALEKTLESPLDSKDIKPVIPKGNQPWVFIGKTDAEAEAPVLWPPDAKSQLTGRGPDAGKDWRQEEKGTTKDEMVRLHHQLNRHEFEQALGDSEGQDPNPNPNPNPGMLQSTGLPWIWHYLVTEEQQQSENLCHHWLGWGMEPCQPPSRPHVRPFTIMLPMFSCFSVCFTMCYWILQQAIRFFGRTKWQAQSGCIGNKGS